MEKSGNQFGVWQKTKHAEAYNALKSPEAEKIAKSLEGQLKSAADLDRIAKPKGGQGGQGGGSGEASDQGEGEDDFVFHLSKEEFMQVFFDDLALPNLARTTLADTPEWRSQRAGCGVSQCHAFSDKRNSGAFRYR